MRHPYILLIIVFGLVVTTAHALITVIWDPPPAYTDGSPLPVSEIDHYTLFYGTAPGEYTDTVTVQGDTTTIPFEDFPIGSVFFVAVKCTATSGADSSFSSQLLIDRRQPSTPDGILIEFP